MRETGQPVSLIISLLNFIHKLLLEKYLSIVFHLFLLLFATFPVSSINHTPQRDTSSRPPLTAGST